MVVDQETANLARYSLAMTWRAKSSADQAQCRSGTANLPIKDCTFPGGVGQSRAGEAGAQPGAPFPIGALQLGPDSLSTETQRSHAPDPKSSPHAPTLWLPTGLIALKFCCQGNARGGPSPYHAQDLGNVG